jgi:predicted ATPase
LLDEWAITDPRQIDYFGGKSLVAQSHGQSLMSYFKSRYGIKGIYFLDEPETALSPKSQIELVKLIENMSSDKHAQFIIATHSPIIMSVKGATIYNFDENQVKTIEYRKTDHYTVFRDFILQTEGNQI